MGQKKSFKCIVISFHVVMVMLMLDFESVRAHQPHDPITSVTVSPNFEYDKTIFIATAQTTINMDVYLTLRSTDGGITWDFMLLPNVQTVAIAISPNFANDQTLFIGTLGKGAFRSHDGGISWQPCNGASGAWITQIVVSPDFANDHTLFVVTNDSMIYRSTECGDSWELVCNFQDYSTKAVKALVICPDYPQDHTLFIGTEGDGVFKSSDDGSTWVNVGLQSVSVWSLKISPAHYSDHELWAGTWGSGIFTATDGGISWVPRNNGFTDLNITDLVLHPDYPHNPCLFASTQSGGVFKSNDGGQTWNPTNIVSRPLSDQSKVHYLSLAISPAYDNDQKVFLAMFEGFWMSHDGGASWNYSEVLPNRLVRNMAFSPDYSIDRTIIIATYGGGIIKSVDGGDTWQTNNTGLNDAYPDYVGVSPNYTNDHIVVAGVPWGLEKSTNSAQTWELGLILNQYMFIRAFGFFPGFEKNKMIIAGTNNKGRNDYYFLHNNRNLSTSGVWLSTTGGDSWMPTMLNGARIFSLAVSPVCINDKTVFAGVGDDAAMPAGIYKSTDLGLNWTKLNTTSYDPYISDVILSPAYARDKTAFAGTLHGGVLKSTDGGSVWTQAPGTEEWEIMDLILSPNFRNDRILFAATFHHGLYKSIDGGNSWVQIPLEMNYFTSLAISPAFAQDQTIMAASYKGIFKSQDSGTSWKQLIPSHRYEDDNDPCIIYKSNWSSVNNASASTSHFYYSKTPLSEAELHFVSSSVSWIGTKGPDMGMAEVYIDGTFSALVDLYDSEQKFQQVLYKAESLTNNSHTLKIVVTGNANCKANGYAVSIDAFDIQ